jgi:hypothetical protein
MNHDKELIEKIAIEVQSEYGMSGLAEGLYLDFATDVTIRYVEANSLNIAGVISWVACSEKLPNVEDNGQKVLIYRIMNDSQASLSISIHETSMVKHCNVNETWWMELPKLPFL